MTRWFAVIAVINAATIVYMVRAMMRGHYNRALGVFMMTTMLTHIGNLHHWWWS